MRNHFAQILTVLTVLAASTLQTQADIVSDFEDLSLAADSHVAGGPGQTSFVSHGVTYNQTFSQFGDTIFPSAFSYSNRLDTTTTGFTNQFSAYTDDASGGAGGSENYAIANNFSRGTARVNFSESTRVDGFYATNTTYAYHAIVSGDDGGGNFVRQFDDGDFFKLEIFGMDSDGNEIGQVDFFLADYRGAEHTVVSNWTWVDLTSLGTEVKELQFNLVSTDSGDFGINTPAYFAIDNVTISAVPEPQSLLVLSVLLGSVSLVRRKIG